MPPTFLGLPVVTDDKLPSPQVGDIVLGRPGSMLIRFRLEIVCVDGETVRFYEGGSTEAAAKFLKENDHEGSIISLTILDPEEIYKYVGLVEECKVAVPFSVEYAGE